MRIVASTRRYAQALFELAAAAGKVDEWQRDLAVVCGLGSDPIIVRGLDSPAIPFAERRRFVERLLDGRVAPQVCNLAVLMAQRSRFGQMPDVSREFDAFVRQSRGIVAASVTSSAPLAGDELAAVKARVEKLAGASVELHQNVDPALIGGVTVTIGDRQIDASVAGRLERLRAELVQGAS